MYLQQCEERCMQKNLVCVSPDMYLPSYGTVLHLSWLYIHVDSPVMLSTAWFICKTYQPSQPLACPAAPLQFCLSPWMNSLQAATLHISLPHILRTNFGIQKLLICDAWCMISFFAYSRTNSNTKAFKFNNNRFTQNKRYNQLFRHRFVRRAIHQCTI